MLYERYLANGTSVKKVTREDLQVWYDGYHTSIGERLYNPRSIVLSLSNNNTGNYWTSSGPYDEIFYYIENNIDEVRDELAHDTEVPLLSYNNETELTAVVNLVYLAARDNYYVEREDKSGIGYVDFIFFPVKDKNADCIILELEVNQTPEEAIWQIKDKKYALRFKGKIGEEPRYTGRILAVGISYDKQQKKHFCRVEVLDKE